MQVGRIWGTFLVKRNICKKSVKKVSTYFSSTVFHREKDCDVLDLHVLHGGARGCPKEAVTQWGAHIVAGSWQDLWTRGERSPRWSRIAGRAGDAAGNPCWTRVNPPHQLTPW